MARHDDEHEESTAVMLHVRDMDPEEGHPPTLLSDMVAREIGRSGVELSWIWTMDSARHAVVHDIEAGGHYAVSVFSGRMGHLETRVYGPED